MVITLTTDFGTRDWFVGTMKGVILKLAPRATLVDITHEIAPGDIPSAAFALAQAAPFFPSGTVHLAVVDPGVGSNRQPVAIQARHHQFVGPDNGVLALAATQEKVQAVHRLTNTQLFLAQVSQTFHGRDLFAPAAAHLSQGLPIARLGPRARTFQKLPWPEAGRTLPMTGQVIYIDRFGNAITNLGNEALTQKPKRLRASGKRTLPIGSHYQSVKPGRPVGVPGSTGYLEIAVNGGDAAQLLGLRVGSKVILE